MKSNLLRILNAAAMLVLLAVGTSAQIASGGSYTLDQAVVANGGGTSAGGNYAAQGTSGQTAAGNAMSGGGYTVFSGFWISSFVPTAAAAKIEGRVVDAAGSGLRNISVTLNGGALTAPRIVKTNSFGNFVFEEVEVGQTYVVSVASRRYGFGQNTRVISLLESVSDIVFQATWEN